MATATKDLRNVARERGETLHQEIEWLRSFHMSVERIAERLGVTEACIESHLTGRRGLG